MLGVSDVAARCALLEEVVIGLIEQFSVTGRDSRRSAGGIVALQWAYEVMGLDDPHFVDTAEVPAGDGGSSENPDASLCDEPDCDRVAICGFPTSDGYRVTCGTHARGWVGCSDRVLVSYGNKRVRVPWIERMR